MILFIDTSKPQTKIALLEKGNILAEKEWFSAKNQSEELLFEMNNLLITNKRSKADLMQIMVATGPGSYTGLRVGLSTANALALSLNIRISGISGEVNYKKLAKKVDSNSFGFTRAVMPKYLYPAKITREKPRR